MTKPPLTTLVMRSVIEADRVKLLKDNEWQYVGRSETPMEPGVYVVLPVKDAELIVKRLQAAEGAKVLERAARRAKKRSGR